MVTTKKIPIEDTKEMRKESEYVTAKKWMKLKRRLKSVNKGQKG